MVDILIVLGIVTIIFHITIIINDCILNNKNLIEAIKFVPNFSIACTMTLLFIILKWNIIINLIIIIALRLFFDSSSKNNKK
jgi:hypothetical protein